MIFRFLKANTYMTKKKPRPLHPFPRLINNNIEIKKSHQTPTEKNILKMLQNGARVLFDMKQKRGLIYSCRRGFETIMEITVRMLASLVKTGQVIAVSRDDRLVHYALIGTSVSWYQPE